MQRIAVIDTHTAGEPTRVVLAGGPDLGAGSLAERVERFRARHDDIRSALVNEPRGSDVMVGALVCTPTQPGCSAGVIFFNNVGFLGMCGHGTMGVVVALAHAGRLAPGSHRLETPVGVVAITLEGRHRVSVDNVPSYRLHKGVSLDVPGLGVISGDIAWGGNWFFLCEDHGLAVTSANLSQLTGAAWDIRRALAARGLRGEKGAEIDHIELFGPATVPGARSKNFVLCPGGAYDRSPCGTGTSGKLACLIADGKLAAGEIWRQESIIGSVFEGSARVVDGKVLPRISGSAYVTGEANLILDPEDPLAMGIRLLPQQASEATTEKRRGFNHG